jgi:hypothetical protein
MSRCISCGKDGGDFVRADHLEPLMGWYKTQ